MPRRHTIIVLAVAGLSCIVADDEPAATFQVDTLPPNRIRVVNSGEPMWTTHTSWSLEEDLRLGRLAGSEGDPEQFGAVRDIAFDSRHRIYVLDAQAQEIRVFGPSGTFLRTIGSHGEGPGEFMFASSIDVGPGDTLVARDDGAMRYSVFAPDGTLVETRRRDLVGTYAPVGPTSLADGSYLDWAVVFPEGRLGPRLQLLPIRYQFRLGATDTFPPLEHTWDMLPSGVPQTYYSGGLVGRADASGNVWFARSDEYRIYRRTIAGDTTLVFGLGAPGTPLGEEERVQLRNDLGRRPDLLNEVLAALPETLPIVLQIVPNDAGHVFVLPNVADHDIGAVVDVFQDNGVYLGRMALPSKATVLPRSGPIVRASADHLLVVTTDELDVSYVSRFRIVRQR